MFERDALQVWQAVGSGVLQLKARDAGIESLGSIVAHSALQSALKRCVLDTDVITIGSDARSISSLPPAAAAAAGHVLFAGESSVACSLLVGADGAASRVRAHAGIGEASIQLHSCLRHFFQSCRMKFFICFSASVAMSYSSRAVVATLQVSFHMIRMQVLTRVCAACREHQHCASALPLDRAHCDAAAGCRVCLSRVDSPCSPSRTNGSHCLVRASPVTRLSGVATCARFRYAHQ